MSLPQRFKHRKDGLINSYSFFWLRRDNSSATTIKFFQFKSFTITYDDAEISGLVIKVPGKMPHTIICNDIIENADTFLIKS